MSIHKTYKKLYWALITTFALLYLAVAFVSTLHAITFFQITNELWLAVLLGAAYEIGQATVLFSIIMTENKNKSLAWLMMFLLTTLQVTANVYASFTYMDTISGNSWTYWQRSILFWVEAETPEMYKIIISWISGALLPLVALGMTALVADNVQLVQREEDDDTNDKNSKTLADEKKITAEDDGEEEDSFNQLTKGISNIFKNNKENKEKDFELDREEEDKINEAVEATMFDNDEAESDDNKPKLDIKQEESVNTDESEQSIEEAYEETQDDENEEEIKPSNMKRGWHLMNRFVDKDGKVFSKGKFIGEEKPKEKHKPKVDSKVTERPKNRTIPETKVPQKEKPKSNKTDTDTGQSKKA